MSTLTDRIQPWTYGTVGSDGIAILILEGDDSYTWLALNANTLEHIARGGPHPTRHDATIDAIEHVPDWNLIRSL